MTGFPPAIILVRPQLGENIGMAARAMLNCGLTDLRLVSPRDGWPQQTAFTASSGADYVIENAKIFETTEDAVKGLEYVIATTARERGMIKPILTPSAAAAEIHARNTGGTQRCGILFGAERTGLENHEITLADAILNIPLNPDFTSLNIAQAVLLVAYSWFSTTDDTPDKVLRTGYTNAVAPKEQVYFLVDRLSDELEKADFYKNPDMKPSIVHNLRNTFVRMELTEQEARTMHGIISALIERK